MDLLNSMGLRHKVNKSVKGSGIGRNNEGEGWGGGGGGKGNLRSENRKVVRKGTQ